MPLRVAIVGCGLIGARRAEVARELGDEVRVVVDVDELRARSLGERVGARHATRLDEALQDTSIDAVIVAAHNNVLAEITRSALEAGKHVLCEKPFAINVSEAETVVAAARRATRVVKVGFNHRYHPAIGKAHAVVESGFIGRALVVRAAYGHGGRAGYEKEWRGDPRRAGGGELLDQGVHVIDLARWFLGDLSVACGLTATWAWPIAPLEDNAFALLRTDDGRVASFHVSWTQWRNLFRFEVIAERGALTIEGLGGNYGPERLTVAERREIGKPPHETQEVFDGPDLSWREEWRDFTSAIHSGTRPLGDVSDGLAAVRIVAALYESAKGIAPAAHRT